MLGYSDDHDGSFPPPGAAGASPHGYAKQTARAGAVILGETTTCWGYAIINSKL
jgi:hypothetical protein